MSITLLHGDCLELMRGMADNSVDAIVTDPPYNEVNRKSGGLRVLDKLSTDSASIDIPSLAKEFIRVASGSIYVWCGFSQFSLWRNEFANSNLTVCACVWQKTNPSPMNADRLWLSSVELCVYARKPKAVFNEFYKSPVWVGPSERVDGFPCPKPRWLMRSIIETSSNQTQTVLDPFMGSGTTGVACVQTGRNFIGIEIDKGYYDIAQRRIEAAQSQQVLLSEA